ncbi:MAG: hypothetical protein D6820_16825, partial [Lentisphaerae bacterium]
MTNIAIPFEVFASFQRLPEASPLFTCQPSEWAAAAHTVVHEDVVHYIWALRKEDGRWFLMHSQAPVEDPAAVTHDPRNPVVVPAETGSFDDYVVEYPCPFFNPHDGKYCMYYLGRRKQIPKQTGLMVMENNDFGQWRRVSTEPVIAAEFSYEEQGSSHPSVAVDGDRIHLIYTGEARGNGQPNYPYNTPTICHATARLDDPAR